MKQIFALDIGTTGLKSAAVDQTGQIVASGYADYPTYTPAPQHVEQEPDDWWRGCCAAIQQLWHKGSKPSDVAAVVLSGQMQDCILLGCDGALGRAILYSDSRAQAEAALLSERIGDDALMRVTGNGQGASSLLAKWLWLTKYRSDDLAKSNALLFGAHDYIAWKLGADPATDYTTATTTGLLNLESKQWVYDWVKTLGLNRWLLPGLQAAEQLAGAVHADAANATGLPVGTPIVRGCGDLGATTLGVGAGEAGRLYAYLGTSGWVAATLTDATPNPQAGLFTLRHPDPSRYIQVAPMLTAGGNLDWLRTQFVDPGAAHEPIGGMSYEQINQLAARAPAGSRGLIYLPYLAGERSPFSDANARACLIGLSAQTTQAELVRSVMEGVAFAYRSLGDTMGALRSEAIYLVGGGAKSAVWSQILADVLDCTVHVADAPEDAGVRGAALIAGRTLGWWDRYLPSESFFPVSQSFTANPVHRTRYDDLYAVYRTLYPALKGSFATLSQLQ